MKYALLVTGEVKGDKNLPKYPVSIGDFIKVNLTLSSLNASGFFHFFIISLISI